METDAIRFIAEVPHVREVSLLGTAELGYWAERLRCEQLAPADFEGKARILILGGQLKYTGIRFREVSFSIMLRGEDARGGEAGFLAQAFNSSRLFSLSERLFFSTPYRHADVRVSAENPASIQVRKGRETIFDACMAADAPDRQPSSREQGGWNGPVFLPGGRKMFFVRIAGETLTYPFVPGDSVAIRPSRPGDVLQALVDSRFTPLQWLIRPDAVHARSKTYAREARAVT